jgi:hypothetical protein
MSYNISSWKTKTLDNLIIPLAEIKKLPHVDVDLDEDGNIEISNVAEVHVKSFHNGGEGSGHSWDEVKKCLQSSTGELIAVLVWESGDYISRLTVKDGVVTEEEIEL